jgi:hypothetical protein
MDEHPVPTPTRQVFNVAPQDLSEDDEVEWLQTLPAAPQVDAPCVLLAHDDILGDEDYDSESKDLDGKDLDVLLPRVQSPDELDRMHQHNLEQKINRCNSNLRRPLVPFRLRKWEKKKRVSQVHSSLLVGVVRRRFGVLLVVQIWHINVLPPRQMNVLLDLALHLFGNQRLCHNQS